MKRLKEIFTKKEDEDRIKYSELAIDSSLGKGASGTVCIATWRNQSVAVKMYSRTTSEMNERDIFRILTSSTSSANIVRYFGYFNESVHGQIRTGIVIEYMSLSLSKFIKTTLQIDNKEKLSIVRDISLALDCLHQLNLIHCDIKSDNILLDTTLHAKLCDFEHSNYQEKIEVGTGTTCWTAPEILNGSDNTKASDIFSLMTTFWEIIAWKEPFNSILEHQVISNVTKHNMRENIPDSCPPKMSRLITWGWKQAPKERPNIKQVLNELYQPDVMNSVSRLP